VKKADRKKRAQPDEAPLAATGEALPPPAEERGLVVKRPFPLSDPAYAVMAGILDVVPSSDWAFARVENGGSLQASDGTRSRGGNLSALVDEYRRQRVVVSVGSRIAASLHQFVGAASGITLIFADERADYGILTLLRDATLPPFSSIEISILTFALDAGTDRLAALRLHPEEQKFVGVAASDGYTPGLHDEAFYVLDNNMEIVLAWSVERQRRIVLTGLHEHIAERLPPVLESSVRELTAAWATSVVKEPGIARPVPFLVVRTQPMTGPAGLFVGVRIDRFRPPNSLTEAAGRFHISPREAQVLALLLDGDHLDQIADQLKITSSTVQDHIKSMLDKTESRNRSELIARILGWEAPPNPRAIF
jgi:DNA-binding CsgD family transcriptional regulator